MLEIAGTAAAIGATIGFLYSLLFINFDDAWKKILSFVIGIGGSGGLMALCYSQFEIDGGARRMLFAASFALSVAGSFIVSLIVLARVIVDRESKRSIRMRDVLLGQKAYIEGYYDYRRRQINEELDVEKLESREKAVAARERRVLNREEGCREEEARLLEENAKIKAKAGEQLTMSLPDRKNVVLTQKFLDSIPSFASDYAVARAALEKATDDLLMADVLGKREFDSYLYAVEAFIIDYLFPGGEIRVHFRYYDARSQQFKMIRAITGMGKEKVVEKSLTPIPFRNSMIEKSFKCQRGVLKSINPDAHYKSRHHTKWKDYLTLAFWTIQDGGIPALTMGISVKNPARYQSLLYFLEFAEFDLYMIDSFEKIDSRFGLLPVLREYGNDNN